MESVEKLPLVTSREISTVDHQTSVKEKSARRVDEPKSNGTWTKSKEPVYTVEDAINHMGFGVFQIIVTLFAGFIWMADAMELMLLAVLGPVLQCFWSITDLEKALITSIVFAGFFFGGFFWGLLTDSIGRKTTLFIVDIIILVFGVASALSPNYWVLLLFRFGMGFGIGGGAQAVTYYTEFLPRRARGVCIVLLQFWWAIGSIFAALLAMAVMPNISDAYDWRVYLGLCAVPLAVELLIFPLVPESARYYVSHGKYEKGMKVMQRVAWWNRKTLPKGRLVSQEEKEQLEAEEIAASSEPSKESEFHEDTPIDMTPEDSPLLSGQSSPATYDSLSSAAGVGKKTCCAKCCNKMPPIKAMLAKMGQDLKAIFTSGMWRTTSILIFLWFGCAWLYYGAVLLTTTILELGEEHCGNIKNTSHTANECSNLTMGFYEDLLWTTAAEFPGILLTLIIIEVIGRKKTMAVEFLGTALFFGLIVICVPQVVTAFFLFGARGFATGVFQAIYVYTPEVYPTQLRGAAMGVTTAAARIGAIITPFVAQVLYDLNDYATLGLYAGSSVVLALLAMLLPIETKGRSLKDLYNKRW